MVVVEAFVVGALRVGAAFFAPGFVMMVVPALLLLLWLSLRSLIAVPVRLVAAFLVCLLGAREDGLDGVLLVTGTVDFTGLVGLAANVEVFSNTFGLLIAL